MKICSKCAVEYPATDEYFEKRDKNTLRAQCRECTGRKKKRSVITKDGFRLCASCGQEKELSSDNFNKHCYNKTGFKAVCRECEKADRKNNPEKYKQYYENSKPRLQEYYIRNKETYQKRDRAWRKEKANYLKEKYLTTQASHIEYARKRYKEQGDRVRAINDKWAKSENGKQILRDIREKRRTQKKCFTSLTNAEWEYIKFEFGRKCAYCGKEKHLTIDHFVSLKAGGELSINNVIPCCISCNSSKGAKDFFDWYPRQEYYSKPRERKILKFLNYQNKIQQLALL